MLQDLRYATKEWNEKQHETLRATIASRKRVRVKIRQNLMVEFVP